MSVSYSVQSFTFQEIAGVRVHVCAPDGPSLADDRNLSDLIGEMFSAGAGMAAIPLTRLGPDFLRLSSGVAGAVASKGIGSRILNRAAAKRLPQRMNTGCRSR